MSLALLTASCDIILVVNLVGTVRFAQIMLALVLLLSIGQVVQARTILWPRGGYALAIWCILQALLITQSSAVTVSIELYTLLLFTILGIYAVLQLYGRSTFTTRLMKVYLLSFVLVSAFGAIQFITPSLHLGQFLIAQWILHGYIPRINGFSYEPSYFATYLIMGWIMLIDLRVSKARITQGRRWFCYLLLVSAVLFLSTSKTAWILMAVEGLARLAPGFWSLHRKQAARFRAGSLIVPLPRPRMVFLTAVVAGTTVLFLTTVNRFIDLNRFLQGTGINGTAAHSVNDRVQGFHDTLTVIGQHFWIGRSLGGVSGSVAALYGWNVHNIQDLHTFWGYPVPLDVFAASGFWGFLPFLWFFLAITVGERSLIRERWNDERAKWLKALGRALVFEWLALFADQNLLRIYLWFHVTMVVVVGYNLRYSKAGPSAAPAERLAIA